MPVTEGFLTGFRVTTRVGSASPRCNLMLMTRPNPSYAGNALGASYPLRRCGQNPGSAEAAAALKIDAGQMQRTLNEHAWPSTPLTRAEALRHAPTHFLGTEDGSSSEIRMPYLKVPTITSNVRRDLQIQGGEPGPKRNPFDDRTLLLRPRANDARLAGNLSDVPVLEHDTIEPHVFRAASTRRTGDGSQFLARLEREITQPPAPYVVRGGEFPAHSTLFPACP